jgi:hypothetical protein
VVLVDEEIQMSDEKKKRFYPKNRKHTKARQLTEFSMKWRPPEEEDTVFDSNAPPRKRKALPRDMKRAMNGKDISGLLWALVEKEMKSKVNGDELLLGEDNLMKMMTEIRRLEELKKQGQKGDEEALLDWINSVVEHEDGEPIQVGWNRGTIFE